MHSLRLFVAASETRCARLRREQATLALFAARKSRGRKMVTVAPMHFALRCEERVYFEPVRTLNRARVRARVHARASLRNSARNKRLFAIRPIHLNNYGAARYATILSARMMKPSTHCTHRCPPLPPAPRTKKRRRMHPAREFAYYLRRHEATLLSRSAYSMYALSIMI